MAQIIIIGGGVAGLSAGIRALLDGHEVMIIERHRTAGGNLTGWDREGYHIDNCIHWLTGTNPVTPQYRVWQELGVLGGEEVYQGDMLYTYECAAGSMSLYRDLKRLEAALLTRSEGDDREIRRLMRAIRAARTLCGISPYDNARPATAAGTAMQMPRLLPYLPLSAGALADRFNSPVIRGFLRSLLSDHFGALALLIVFATYCSDNGGIPAGSSCAMAQRMTERFRSLGGLLRCGAAAAEIHIADGAAQSVALADGSVLAADDVVLACDPDYAFGTLLDRRYLPRGLRRRYRDPRLSRFSGFHCAFACMGERLPFSGDLILDAPAALRMAFGTDYLILREFSHEPDFAPAGNSLIQAMCFCTPEQSARWITLSADAEAYRAEKERLTGLISRSMCACLPRLNGRLRCIDCWTPATYRRYTGAPTGSYLAFTLPQGRIPRRLPPKVPGLRNVFLATQWQQEPGGLPTAACAGIAAAEAIRRLHQCRGRRPRRPGGCSLAVGGRGGSNGGTVKKLSNVIARSEATWQSP